MNIKGIIFDKDGTLFKFDEFWIPVAKKAAEYIASKVNAPEETVSEMLTEIGIDKGISGVLCWGTYSQIAEAFSRILKRYDIDCENIKDITSEAFHNCLGFGKIVPACENIEDVFSNLKNNGMRIFLATADDEYLTDICLQKLGIKKYFDEIFADDGIHRCKPDPYYINKIVDRYNIERDELVMVGDTMTDINFARNGEIMAVGVASNKLDKSIIKKGAAVVISDISQLTNVLNEIQAF